MSEWRSALWLEDYHKTKLFYESRYARKRIKTPVLLCLRQGSYYADILMKEEKIKIDEVIAEGLIITTKGREKPKLEDVIKALNDFKSFQQKPNAISIGDSADFQDQAYNIHRHTAVSLYRIDLDKYLKK